MDGQSDPLLAAELLCDQLAHRFGGSVGMLANLMEVARERSAHSAEALAVAEEIAAQLANRLRLLRAAWGSSGDTLDLSGLETLAAGLKKQRCALRLEGLTPETVFQPHAARMLLNLVLLAADSLASEGEIMLSGAADDFVIAIAGPKASWPPGLAACVANPDVAWQSLTDMRRFQAGLTALLAPRLGFRLSFLMAPGPPASAPPLRVTAI